MLSLDPCSKLWSTKVTFVNSEACLKKLYGNHHCTNLNYSGWLLCSRCKRRKFWRLLLLGLHSIPRAGTHMNTRRTRSTQLYSRLREATHHSGTVVIPGKSPLHNTHTFSSVQSPLLSIYKHPKSLTGLSVCTTTGGGGKERTQENTGFGVREDIRTCKFIQWLKRERACTNKNGEKISRRKTRIKLLLNEKR